MGGFERWGFLLLVLNVFWVFLKTSGNFYQAIFLGFFGGVLGVWLCNNQASLKKILNTINASKKPLGKLPKRLKKNDQVLEMSILKVWISSSKKTLITTTPGVLRFLVSTTTKPPLAFPSTLRVLFLR